MSSFLNIGEIIVPQTVVESGQAFMQDAGRRGCEGMVLWIGCPADNRFEVRELLIPKQRGIRTPDGVCVVVDGDELHRINVALFRSGQRLIAQLHSHPTHAYHSPMDDAHAVATTVGCVSIVVPNFASSPFSVIGSAVYRLAENGKWIEIAPGEASKLIRITGTAHGFRRFF